MSLLAEALDHAADEPEQVGKFADRLSVESTHPRASRARSSSSRLQARDALRRDELLDIDRIVAAAVDQNRVVAAAKGVEVAVRAKSGAEVYGDQALLVVVVHNQVANAIASLTRAARSAWASTSTATPSNLGRRPGGIGNAADDLDRGVRAFCCVDQGALAQHRRLRARPQHRQAHRAESRRRRARLVAAGSRIHVHYPAAARPDRR